ncbi:extracellular solute-binding protein [Aquirhabdus sp.]|uniref:extracellular solute-binding protein n=1 Tax=Aquirhabdus sp. TaxID=2824160 RepID=UPI00396CBF8A
MCFNRPRMGSIQVIVVSLVFFLITPAFAIVTTSNAIALNGTPLHSQDAFFPYANPNAPKGGTFSTMAQGTFDSLNALISKGTAVNGTAYLSDSLLATSLDEPSVAYGLLADKITRDTEDPSWIIFHIHPNARFSNQQPVTADDVVFTFETILTRAVPGLRSYYGDIKKVTAVDQNTVRFDFKTKHNRKIAFAIGQMSILSRQDWKNRPFDQVTMTPPLGSGPYIVESIDAGRSIIYKRNPQYWGRDLLVNQGKYNFDRIKYLYYRDLDTAFQGFKVGQYTFRLEKSERSWVRGYDFPAIKSGLVIKQVLPNRNPITMSGLVFNLRQSKFQNLKVRQALTLAFDFEWLNKSVLNGQYTRLQSYFFNSELEAKGLPPEAELVYLRPLLPHLSNGVQQGILSSWQAPMSDGQGFNRDNLLKARQLLLNAGYRYVNGHLFDAHGQPYKIEFLSNDESQQRIILPFIRNLEKLGISASLRVVDIPQYIERTRRFDYDMIMDTFPQTLTPSSEQQGYWGSQVAEQSGSLNTAGIQNLVVDALLKQLVIAKDRRAIINLSRALDRVLRAEFYMIPLYGFLGNRVAFWNLYQMPKQRPLYDIGVDYWWIDAKAEQRVNQYLGSQ